MSVTLKRIILLALSIVAAILVIRDVIYRIFFIHPRTDLSGRYAAAIEGNHIYRWLVPVLTDRQNTLDVMFAGNSHVMDGIDPAVVAQETGYTSYNLALYSLPAQNALDLLIKYKSYPRLIFIDFAARYSVYKPNTRSVKMADAILRHNRRTRFIHEVQDRMHCLMPSLFIPKPYRNIAGRGTQKIKKWLQTGRIELGRYTPFRIFVGYEWSIDKTTNHRIVHRKRPPRHHELRAYAYYFQKCVQELPHKCDTSSPAYREGMQKTEHMISHLLENQVQVIMMRMPIDPRLVSYENMHFAQFYQDVQAMADRLGVDWVDLNRPEHLQHIGSIIFYTDGQHMLHTSARQVSRYLATLAIQKLGPKQDGSSYDNSLLHSA